MKAVIIIGVLLSGCANGNFARGLNVAYEGDMEPQRQYWESQADAKPIHHEQTGMRSTDWKCMSDCQKAHYKQATCDNMFTSD